MLTVVRVMVMVVILMVVVTCVQGTRSSKRKKQAKLQRAMATVRKAERRAAGGANGNTGESFAAIHLLYDPHTWAEKLFARLQVSADPRKCDPGIPQMRRIYYWLLGYGFRDCVLKSRGFLSSFSTFMHQYCCSCCVAGWLPVSCAERQRGI